MHNSDIITASEVQLTLDNSNEQISLTIEQATVNAFQAMIQTALTILGRNPNMAGEFMLCD
jgi:hypothetical protein